MALPVDEARMKAEIQKLVDAADLANTSIGGLRADLTKALGLKEGALEARKEVVSGFLKDAVSARIKREAAAAKDAAAAAKEATSAKRKAPADAPDKDPKKDKKAEALKAIAGQKKPESPANLPPKKEIEETKESEERGEQREKEEKEEKEEPAKEQEPKTQEAEVALEAEQAELILEPAAPPPQLESELPPAETAAELMARTKREREEARKHAKMVKPWALSGGEDGCLRLWDMETHTCVRLLEGHTDQVNGIVVDWQEMEALSGSADGTARRWDLKTGGCQRTFKDAAGGCTTLAGCWDVPDESHGVAIGGCGDGKLRRWCLGTGETLDSVDAHLGGVWALDVDWKGHRAASGGDEHVKVWSLKDWSCLHTVAAGLGSAGVTSIAMNFDANTALVGLGSSDPGVALWDFETKKPINLVGHRDAVSVVLADFDDEKAITCGWDALIRTWNLDTKASQGFQVKFGRVRSMVAHFASKRVICGSSEGTLHVLDLGNNAAELNIMEGHVGGVTALKARF